MQVSSFGDVFCQSYEVDESKGTLPRDKTCSAGVASDGVSLSDEVFSSVRRWLDDAELQLSAAAAAKMIASDDVTCYNVHQLFDGLCRLSMFMLTTMLLQYHFIQRRSIWPDDFIILVFLYCMFFPLL